MNDLIKVGKTVIGEAQVQTVSARELYEALGLDAKSFSRWAEMNLSSNGFAIQGVDFIEFCMMQNGRSLVDFALTIDFAKRLSMLTRTQKGEDVRTYFLECERRALQPQKALTPAEALHQMTGLMVEQERRVTAIEAEVLEHSDKLKRIESKQQAFEEGSKFFTIVGYAVYRGITEHLGISEASQLGKRATALSKEREFLIDKVRDPRWGRINAYHESVLETVFEELLS